MNTIFESMQAENEKQLEEYHRRKEDALHAGYGILQVSLRRYHVIELRNANGDNDFVYPFYEIISEKPMDWQTAREMVKKLRQL